MGNIKIGLDQNKLCLNIFWSFTKGAATFSQWRVSPVNYELLKWLLRHVSGLVLTHQK